MDYEAHWLWRTNGGGGVLTELIEAGSIKEAMIVAATSAQTMYASRIIVELAASDRHDYEPQSVTGGAS